MSQRISRQGSAGFGLRLKLAFPGKEGAERAMLAVLPELNAAYARRSATSLGIKSGILSIDMHSRDAAAMRAAFNSCMNSIILAKSVMEV